MPNRNGAPGLRSWWMTSPKSDRVAERAHRLEVHGEVRLGGQLVRPAAQRLGDVRHHGQVAGVLGGHDHGLGRVGDHRLEALEVRALRLDVVGMCARHDEVDVGQRVAEPRGAGDVGESAGTMLAGLDVVGAHEVRAGPEVAVGPAERHGRLAGAVEDLDHRRRRDARLLHELARDPDEVGLGDLAARGPQQLERLGVQHAHADRADDLERGLVDGRLVGVGEVGHAAGARPLFARACPSVDF